MAFPWLLVGVLCWLLYQTVLQNGRLLLRMAALERSLALEAPAAPQGLAAGTPAPDFTLPDLSGGPRSLRDFRGQAVLLVFSNPGCGYCVQMADAVANWRAGGAKRPALLIVTGGDAKNNQEFARQHALTAPILLDEKSKVSRKYQARGTPTGYRIDENGILATSLLVGAQALLAAADAKPATAPNVNGAEAPRGKANRGVEHSRIPRDGLKPGAPAPAFRLPRVDGGELALEDYRGRRVLLVFSDPQCGPCQFLTPWLEGIHRRHGDWSVMMISRGAADAHRAKLAEHEVTFPVALQKSWEISRQFATFSTPVAYWIDERGVIAAEAAVGIDAIQSLIATPVNAG